MYIYMYFFARINESIAVGNKRKKLIQSSTISFQTPFNHMEKLNSRSQALGELGTFQ